MGYVELATRKMVELLTPPSPCREYAQENDELREELQKQAVEKENGVAESELKELKGLLAEREAQLITLSHRLAERDSAERSGVLTPNGSLGGRSLTGSLSTGRDSLMERIGFGNMKTSIV